MELNFSELRELVAALNQTDIAELTLKSDAFELTLRKRGTTELSAMAPNAGLASPGPISSVVAPASSPAASGPAEEESKSAPTPDANLVDITSPMVGTFYRAPAPDEPPFVEIGDRIQTGQTVCIIEAMKLMNELEAEVSGEVVEILMQNAEPVEFGQVLMRVRPS
ncbi:Biotin carboxyl carrier protein of acetyl-CoA carboxylase [Halomicronema hongdechloris C2206]|uniref:Biotin carboxyl carrier protein of acetyl-CoA carboxylase n=1 Tax=Halomicronema hongdechloris C2206 TaxID=1641165 RepID=A0A1Z3HFT5_9CYAN|nr:acetyl-CoA carboxylase biotin carboxyl carrier protein [Halomicronema hongdechloris]ASC69146.1 Biotin carboxyl carrier protein of acetyl-CoA carboxylase [Halomicronema hongdechloris C2206]